MNYSEFKVIFLDIDEVLNYPKRNNPTRIDVGRLDYLNKDSVAIFNNIIEHIPDAKIVISSSWRILYTLEELQYMLCNVGGLKGDIIGVTDVGGKYSVRGCEIRAWVNANQPKSYVIIDDSSDMLLWQVDRFVHINSELGIQQEDANKAIVLLQTPRGLLSYE